MSKLFKNMPALAGGFRIEPRGSRHNSFRSCLIVILVGLLIFVRPLSAFASGTVATLPQTTAATLQYRPVGVYVTWGNACQYTDRLHPLRGLIQVRSATANGGLMRHLCIFCGS